MPPDFWLPLVLFVVFALLSMVGAYLALNSLRGRRAALAGAAGTAVFFAVLLAVVLALMRNSGLMQ